MTGTAFHFPMAFIGSPAQHNHRFQLEIWLVGLDQVQAINTYNGSAARNDYPGMAQPPDGTTIVTSRQVLRN